MLTSLQQTIQSWCEGFPRTLQRRRQAIGIMYDPNNAFFFQLFKLFQVSDCISVLTTETVWSFAVLYKRRWQNGSYVFQGDFSRLRCFTKLGRWW